jgi:hypothetical protein
MMEVKVQFIAAQPPFVFALTTEGDVSIEFGAGHTLPGLLPPIRMGIVIPAAEARNLLAGLQRVQTTQETLAAKAPKPGLH